MSSNEQNFYDLPIRNLFNEVSRSLNIAKDQAALYVLSWLAIHQMLLRGDIDGGTDIENILDEGCWKDAVTAGLPTEAFRIVWSADSESSSQEALRIQILALLSNAQSGLLSLDCDVADLISEFTNYGAGYDGKLCDAIIDLLQAPTGNEIWIPFDVSGQLTSRALRKGLRVTLAGPSLNSRSVLIAQLIALLEDKADSLTVGFNPKSNLDLDDYRIFDFVIACPPIGMKIPIGAGWHQWDTYEKGLPGAEAIYRRLSGQNVVELDRVESWAIAAFWPRVRQRAVFLTSPNVLFAKGQEQRLREYVVHGLKQPIAVISLPSKMLHQAGISTALTIFDRRNDAGYVRMVDASSITIESSSTMRFSRQLDAEQVVKLVDQHEEVEGVSKNVGIDQIALQECNLMPMRYLKALHFDDGDRVTLGELVEVVVRAPVPSKEATATEAQEVGIADLGKWTRLQGPFAKSTMVQSKKIGEYKLQPNDIIISIKGTIGKVGVMGASENTEDVVVCAQNVIAIRPKSNRVQPIALYLYLRSEDFKNQLEAFRVGVAVAHITPTTLLQDVKVPQRLLHASNNLDKQFIELCELESEVERANQRIEEIRKSL